MTKFDLNEYIRQRDAGMPKPDLTETSNTRSTADEIAKPATIKTSPKEKEEGLVKTGQPMDASWRNMAEYEKMLDFLKGKKSKEAEGSPVPKGVPRKFFVVDESANGFWVNGGWSQDESLAHDALIDSEKAAKEIARVVGGVVVPAEEILG